MFLKIPKTSRSTSNTRLDHVANRVFPIGEIAIARTVRIGNRSGFSDKHCPRSPMIRHLAALIMPQRGHMSPVTCWNKQPGKERARATHVSPTKVSIPQKNRSNDLSPDLFLNQVSIGIKGGSYAYLLLRLRNLDDPYNAPDAGHQRQDRM